MTYSAVLVVAVDRGRGGFHYNVGEFCMKIPNNGHCGYIRAWVILHALKNVETCIIVYAIYLRL